ncbi:MAG: co-chaperone GroES [Nevskia sp.]|jgi:chaperonin GroES|uniref:co-chaperone GroES n=1 Tax=Nevskia soli TaxID=418856 RepID=UPI0004A6FA5D|nr:co-chaperone GroES [Nevskia soli]MDB5973971.1 co-chaperone GroES [Nevskia sp.]
MKLRPLHDRVIVKRLEEEKKTAGGIIIPDQAAEKPLKAEVVAVGPGKITDDGKLQAPDIKKGDHVLIGKYSGTEVRVEGEDLVVLREDDIMAVFTK